ncbi:hypothetical protein ES702_06681 [subsurface metagenome]
MLSEDKEIITKSAEQTQKLAVEFAKKLSAKGGPASGWKGGIILPLLFKV